MQKIPMLDLSPEIDFLWEEINNAIQHVLRSTHFIMGPNVKEFEAECAAYLGTKFAIAVNSGTDALVIGLRAAGVGAGDEVITTPFTFFATAEAISQVGATPVFVDIDPHTLNIDPAKVKQAVTQKTKAILPVHLYGQAAEMAPFLELASERNLKVIEDVAQAFGAEYGGRKTGAMGDAGCYSFFPSKNLGAYGDGGLIATNDERLAEQARMLRAHGSKKKYYNETVGYNSRLDEMQAAILRVKLRHIEEWNAGRIQAANRYRELLQGMEFVTCVDERAGGKHVYHQFTIRVQGGRRDEVQKRLSEAGVDSMIYYPVPLHRLPLYESLGVTLPETEAAAKEVLSLPIWPQMTEDLQQQVVQALRKALS